MPTLSSPFALPDGVRDEHTEPPRFFSRHASPLSLLVLGALLGAALSGLAGGGARSEQAVRNAEGEFAMLAPRITRNGDIMETRFRVLAAKRIDKLVIGVEPALWRQITTNSTMPDAADESFEDGLVRFSFAALDAGKAFEFKVAQQVNPDLVGSNAGRIVFLDGDRTLAEMRASLTVLP